MKFKQSNKIIKGDVIEVLKKARNNYFDLIVADPPYNQGKEKWDTFSKVEYESFMKNWISIAWKKLKPGGAIFIFNNPYNSAKTISIMENLENFNFRNWIVWYKKDGFNVTKSKFVTNQETIIYATKGKPKTFNYELVRIPYESADRMAHATKAGILKNGKRWFPNENGKLSSDVWHFSSERHSKKVAGKTIKLPHPTQKPEKLIQKIILASSNEGDVILDLFSGSGTTSFVAKKLKRNSLGVEKDAKFFQIAEKRVKNA